MSKTPAPYSRMQAHRLLRLTAAALGILVGSRAAAERPNILFLAVDDLRPAIGAYGDPHAITPHLDRLARSGTTFLRAYCQQAICSPSRTSVLTGLRPDSTGVYDLTTHFRTNVPDVVTLPQLFRQHGYRTVGRGKLFHNTQTLDDLPSWDSPPRDGRRPRGLTWALPENQPRDGRRGPSWEKADVPDETYQDGVLAAEAADLLRDLANGDQPFFLAVGFQKPHLPFAAPSRYWDLYDREKLWPPANRELPAGAPGLAGQFSWELRNGYPDAPRDYGVPLDRDYEKTLRHGYYAAVSYVDAQIGRVLDALEQTGLAGNTVVVVWGDHGFHAGDHGFWCKHTNFEVAVHSPLIIRAPGTRAGGKAKAPVELVDLYPTLAELCRLPVSTSLEGTSLVPWLEDPARPGIKAAYSQYPRGEGADAVMGYSARTERWRYTEWLHLGSGRVLAVELYDLENDPASTRNLAGAPGLARTAAELSRLLDQAGKEVPRLRTLAGPSAPPALLP